MLNITHAQFIATVAALRGAVIIGLRATVDTRARKTGNPFGAIAKRVRAVGFVGANYGNAVVREGARQGAGDAATFTPEPLPWGEWLVANKVIVHNGEHYLRTESTPGQRNRQPARVLGYIGEQGQPLSHAQVAPFLPAKRESAKQQAHGLTETVHVRTYKLSNIETVRFGGKTYRLVPN